MRLGCCQPATRINGTTFKAAGEPSRRGRGFVAGPLSARKRSIIVPFIKGLLLPHLLPVSAPPARAHLACLRFGPLALLVLATYACHLSRARARPHKAVLPCLRHHGVRSLNFFGALELPNASRVALSRCTRWNRFRYVTGQSLRIGAASSKHTSPSLLRMWKRLELQWARCGAEQETRITTWQLTVSL